MNQSFDEILEKLFTDLDLDRDDQDIDSVCRDLFSDDVWDHSELVDLATEKYGLDRVEGEYGGEGQSEYCYSIIGIDGKFFKAEWSYYSYNGCEFDGVRNTVREVTPVERLVTVYE